MKKHCLVISDNGRMLVSIELDISLSSLLDDEIYALLDLYSKIYSYPREKLSASYIPLVKLF